VTVLGLGTTYGGVGGGFHTLQMSMPVPAGALQTGGNTLDFRFNQTDGRVSGFRVLAFNIQDSSGQAVIPPGSFVNDDPTTWQPPSTAASDISAGQTLWTSAALLSPNGSGGSSAIQAHCSDCHAVDGRDLKYFNYSNNSIQARSVFHGLTAQQGSQIASYIRSLNLPNPGRPWNPPYQPGPGMDSVPVADWSAGAGINAVLDTDAEMQPYLLPGGSSAGWAANQYVNPREMPIAFQLPDWNSWLPMIHPMDAFGSTFTNSTCATLYPNLKNGPLAQSPLNYGMVLGTIRLWYEGCDETYLLQYENTTTNWTSTLRQQVYSNALWRMVKTWELNQTFGLEGLTSIPYGADANPRGWYTNPSFNSSPNQLHIPGGPGLGNGTDSAQNYLSFSWYQLQLILNDGQGQEKGESPIDYPYVSGILQKLTMLNNGTPEAMLQLLWIAKALQEETLHGVGPDQGSFGFQPTYVDPSILAIEPSDTMWLATSSALRATLMQDYLTVWFAQIQQYTPQQYYTGSWAKASDNPSQLNPNVTFGGQLWYLLPRYRNWGVSSTLTHQVAVWAATIWPKGNWALTDSATCDSQNVHCTSDGN
jgi:hypothetical protein